MSEYSRINKLKRANKNLHMAKQKNNLADLSNRYGVGAKRTIKKLRHSAMIHRHRAAMLRMQAI